MTSSNHGQHDIVTAHMSQLQREVMYDLLNRLYALCNNHPAHGDGRIVSIAILRCLAATMAQSEWGREPATANELAALLPLYVNAAIQSNDGSRILRPFSRLT